MKAAKKGNKNKKEKDSVRVIKVEREDGFVLEIKCYDKNGRQILPERTWNERREDVVQCPCVEVYNKPLPSCPMCNGTKYVQMLKKWLTYGDFKDRESDIHKKIMIVKTNQTERVIEVG